MKKSIVAELVPASPSNWKDFGRQIYAIEQGVFGEKAFTEDMMRTDINDPQALLVLLKKGGAVIGFVYALPEDQMTACVVDIAIAGKHQGQGLVSLLMSCLEAELKRAGYDCLTEHAMVENGYADKITENYGPRIIESREFDGDYGRQRYFKIRL